MGEAARRRRLGVPNTHDRNAWILAEKGIFYSSPEERKSIDVSGFQDATRAMSGVFDPPNYHGTTEYPGIPTVNDIDRVMHFEDETK